MYEEILDFSVSNGNIKGPVGKSICAENLSLQLFRAGPRVLDHMLVKLEPSRIVRNVPNIELFDNKEIERRLCC